MGGGVGVAAALFQGWLDLQAREGQRLTYDDLAGRLARRMGTAPVTKAAVAQWFRGRRVPDIQTFFALCDELGLDPRTVARAQASDAASVRAMVEEAARRERERAERRRLAGE